MLFFILCVLRVLAVCELLKDCYLVQLSILKITGWYLREAEPRDYKYP